MPLQNIYLLSYSPSIPILTYYSLLSLLPLLLLRNSVEWNCMYVPVLGRNTSQPRTEGLRLRYRSILPASNDRTQRRFGFQQGMYIITPTIYPSIYLSIFYPSWTHFIHCIHLPMLKIESGKLALDEHPFSIPSCVEGVVDMFKTREKQIAIKQHLGENLPPYVM